MRMADVHPHPNPPPSRGREEKGGAATLYVMAGQDRISRACAALDAVAGLIGSCADLHVAPADGLAQLVDILVGELRLGLEGLSTPG